MEPKKEKTQIPIQYVQVRLKNNTCSYIQDQKEKYAQLQIQQYTDNAVNLFSQEILPLSPIDVGGSDSTQQSVSSPSLLCK